MHTTNTSGNSESEQAPSGSDEPSTLDVTSVRDKASADRSPLPSNQTGLHQSLDLRANIFLHLEIVLQTSHTTNTGGLESEQNFEFTPRP